MNLLWDISAKTYESAAAMRAEAAERHRRLRTPERRQIIAPVVKPVVVVLRTEGKIEEKRKALFRHVRPDASAHVEAYRAWMAEGTGSPCKAYIMRRAADFGFTYSQIVGPSRLKKLIEPRHRIMWEIKRHLKPEISFPELGRLFGGRDHTSTMWAVKKIDGQQDSAFCGVLNFE